MYRAHPGESWRLRQGVPTPSKDSESVLLRKGVYVPVRRGDKTPRAQDSDVTPSKSEEVDTLEARRDVQYNYSSFGRDISVDPERVLAALEELDCRLVVPPPVS